MEELLNQFLMDWGKRPMRKRTAPGKVILGSLVLKIVLICFQLWRPFKAEQQDRNEDIESGDEIVEEGSNTAWFYIAVLIGCPVFIAFVSTIIFVSTLIAKLLS